MGKAHYVYQSSPLKPRFVEFGLRQNCQRPAGRVSQHEPTQTGQMESSLTRALGRKDRQTMDMKYIGYKGNNSERLIKANLIGVA